VVEYRSQILVKYWSNTGQILVKYRRNVVEYRSQIPVKSALWGEGSGAGNSRGTQNGVAAPWRACSPNIADSEVLNEESQIVLKIDFGL
jgi:hypothetical protein